MKKLYYKRLKSICFSSPSIISLVFSIVLLSSTEGVAQEGIAAIIVNCTEKMITGRKANNIVRETFTLQPSQYTVIGCIDGNDIEDFFYEAQDNSKTSINSKISISASGTSEPKIVQEGPVSKVKASYTSKNCPSYDQSNPYILYIDVFSDGSIQNCLKDLGCNTVNNILQKSAELGRTKKNSALFERDHKNIK